MADKAEYITLQDTGVIDPAVADKKTPAGGVVHVAWNRLRDAIECFAVFVAEAKTTLPPGKHFGWHVVFRCGTVAYVGGPGSDHPEFRGFDLDYTAPPHDPELTETMTAVMEDNQRVWDAQRVFPEPIGTVIRQAYSVLARGGSPGEDWKLCGAKAGTLDAGETFYLISQGAAGETPIFNLAFSNGADADAAQRGVDGRTFDYLFPEVAAVFAPTLDRWLYDENGEFTHVD